MAQELDLDQLRCDNGDGRLAVAFGFWGPSPNEGWGAFCSPCLKEYQHNDPAADAFSYVRFRDDRDRNDA